MAITNKECTSLVLLRLMCEVFSILRLPQAEQLTCEMSNWFSPQGGDTNHSKFGNGSANGKIVFFPEMLTSQQKSRFVSLLGQIA